MRFLNVIFKALESLIIAFLVVMVVLLLVLPLGFNIKPYVVQSGSMEPMIQTGSMVWIDQRDTDVEIGDVIAYRLSDELRITHRIVDEEDGMYITQGDANENVDLAPVSKDQVMGTYLFSIPVLGYVLTTLRQYPIFAAAFVGAILLILLLSSIVGDEVEAKKKRNAIQDWE